MPLLFESRPVYVFVPLTIQTGSLPNVNQYATSYSQNLIASGGAPPYTWTLVSQSGANPNTWQLSPSGVLTNQMSTILNVETANLVVQVADVTRNSVQATLTLTTVRQIPAGAAALGYNYWLAGSQPNLGNIYSGAYATVPGEFWSSGWPYSNVIPPAALYSVTPAGVLNMHNLGVVMAGPGNSTPIITGAQLTSTTTANDPQAGPLPLPLASAGYWIGAKLQSSVGDPNIRPAIFTLPLNHQANEIDPNDGNNHRWLEKDTWEGSGGNGKQTVGAWNGALPWSGQSGANQANNPNFGPTDITLEHEYASAYVPSTGTLNVWLDNVANGSCTVQVSPGVPLTPEQLAWVNAMPDYPMICAFNDGTTPFTLSVYEFDIYVGPLNAPTFSPAGGSYASGQTVTLNGFGASVYYTTDGSTPTYPVTGTTQLYTAPLSVTIDTTIQAIAVYPYYPNSAVSSANYLIALTPLWP